MTTLFSLKGMCAFNEECGTPSPCFPIKGGGEPHFWAFTFLGTNSCSSLAHTRSFPLLRHMFVRSSLPCACEFVVLVLLVFLVFECSCSVVDARCSFFSAFVVFVFVCTCAYEFGVCYSTNSSSPIPQYHFIFLCPPYSCPSLCFAIKRLRENVLYAKLEKCSFDCKQVEFLGYVISSKGISMDPAKVQTVL